MLNIIKYFTGLIGSIALVGALAFVAIGRAEFAVLPAQLFILCAGVLLVLRKVG